VFPPNKLIALIILCLSPFVAIANQPLVADVSYDNGVYSSSLSANIHAQRNAVYQLLTAYDSLNTFSRLIYKSQLLSNGNLLINIRHCFFIICFDKRLTLSLNVSASAVIAHVVPEHSDFKSGLLKWQLSDSQAGTFIRFSGKLAPDFWVPPIIGPILIKNKLRSEATYSFKQLEHLSQANNDPQKKAP